MLRVWRTTTHMRTLFFWGGGEAFLDCAYNEYKKQMEENEPASLLFTSTNWQKIGVEVTPLCRETTCCTVREKRKLTDSSLLQKREVFVHSFSTRKFKSRR